MTLSRPTAGATPEPAPRAPPAGTQRGVCPLQGLGPTKLLLEAVRENSPQPSAGEALQEPPLTPRERPTCDTLQPGTGESREKQDPPAAHCARAGSKKGQQKETEKEE